MPITITDQQLATIQAKVADLVAAKGAADAATATANQAASDLVRAQATASDAATAEAVADGAFTADLQDLTSFVESLTGVPTPTPAP